MRSVYQLRRAAVAKLADAYASGAYGGNPMEVRLLSAAPNKITRLLRYRLQIQIVNLQYKDRSNLSKSLKKGYFCRCLQIIKKLI